MFSVITLLKIRTEAKSSPTSARVLRLDIPSKTIITPQRSLTAKRGGFSELSLLSDKVNVIEIYKNVSIERLNDIDGDKDKQDDFVSEFLKPINTIPKDTVVFGIFEIAAPKDGLIQAKHIDYISDLIAAPQVDVVATPLFAPKLCGGEDAWFDLTKRYIDSVRDKQIIAAIPSIPHTHVGPYMRKLLKLDIRMFALEFNGTNPASTSKYPHVRAIKRLISEQDENDTLLFYGLNVKYGKIINPNEPTPARDMLSPIFGVDIFGTNHKRAFTKMPQKPPVYRILDDKNYFYQNPSRPEQAKYLCDTPGCKFSINNLRSIIDPGDKRDYVKCINAEKQTAELAVLNRIIREDADRDYVMSKPGVASDPNLRKMLNEVAEQYF